MKTIEERRQALFEELVPPSGKCQSVAGELIRALSRIQYRFYNDGDMIGLRYGNETCNPPARYLMKNGSSYISTLIDHMWSVNGNESLYECILNNLVEEVVCHVETNSVLKLVETDDMWDYAQPEDFDYEDDDDIY